jgi:hypothetical protein
LGFSGGGSNILKPHTHDSTILQDGGNLNFQNVTQANMSAGSITQSDGIHLQELPIGTPAQSLQVNAGATALEYYTPSDHVSTSIQQVEMAADFTTTSGVFVDITNLTFTALNNAFNSYSHFLISWGCTTTGITIWFQIMDDVTAHAGVTFYNQHGGVDDLNSYASIPHSLDNDGQVVKAQTHGNGVATVTIKSSSAWRSFVEVLEVQ